MTNTAEVKRAVSCRWCAHEPVCHMLKTFEDARPVWLHLDPGYEERLKAFLGPECDHYSEETPKFQIPEWLACEHLNTYGRNDTMEEVCGDCGATRPLNRGMPWEAPRQK